VLISIGAAQIAAVTIDIFTTTFIPMRTRRKARLARFEPDSTFAERPLCTQAARGTAGPSVATMATGRPPMAATLQDRGCAAWRNRQAGVASPPSPDFVSAERDKPPGHHRGGPAAAIELADPVRYRVTADPSKQRTSQAVRIAATGRQALAAAKNSSNLRELTMSSTFDKIADIIAETCDIPRDTIKPENHAINDLGIDSLDFLDIAFAIDKAFGIKMPLEKWTQEVNDGKQTTEHYFVLQNLCARIDELVAAKGA
jgi:acyl carrier protein